MQKLSKELTFANRFCASVSDISTLEFLARQMCLTKCWFFIYRSRKKIKTKSYSFNNYLKKLEDTHKMICHNLLLFLEIFLTQNN